MRHSGCGAGQHGAPFCCQWRGITFKIPPLTFNGAALPCAVTATLLKRDRRRGPARRPLFSPFKLLPARRLGPPSPPCSSLCPPSRCPAPASWTRSREPLHLRFLLLEKALEPHDGLLRIGRRTGSAALTSPFGRALFPFCRGAACSQRSVACRTCADGECWLDLVHLHLLHICAGTGLTPCHICAGTRLTHPTSAPGLGSPLPHLHRDWAHACHICAGVPHLRRSPGADVAGVGLHAEMGSEPGRRCSSSRSR